ncbi:MAG: hypothetical protein HKO59_04755 [Phycisphaerales bacterium]|nr:hypothetical protein [Phycisphaerales bacterium]NNM25287.1 hypothetical protein [Phycisphaerales bacterium]
MPGALGALLDVLERQAERHEALLELVRRKREAIRTARIDDIVALCAEEQRQVVALNTLEEQRLDIVERMLPPEQAGAAPVVRLADVLSGVDPVHAAELQRRAESLRLSMEQLKGESSVVNAAAQTLARHLAGLMQTVQTALSQVGVYERRGRIALGARLESCVDVTS